MKTVIMGYSGSGKSTLAGLLGERRLAPVLYLTLGLVVTAGLVVLLYRWILTKGAKIFAFL